MATGTTAELRPLAEGVDLHDLRRLSQQSSARSQRSATDVAPLLLRLARLYPSQVERLAGRPVCPHCGFDDADRALHDYIGYLRQLVENYGFSRVEAAIIRGICEGFVKEDGSVNRSFLPMPAEISAMIDVSEQQRRQSAKRADPECQKCHGTSWRTVAPDEARAVRCECYQVRAS